MSACGDSSNPQQRLAFNTSAPEQYDIKKFKNADYLYESYFGEFNLPATFKDQISVELQMVANGFAMSEAKGEDVQQKMKFMDTTIRTMFGTREMQEEIKNMGREVEIQKSKQNLKPILNKSEDENGGGPDPSFPDLSIEDSPTIADPGWEAYLKEQAQSVDKYNLPYPLPTSATKVLDLAQSLTMSKHPGRGNDPPPPKTYHHDPYGRWPMWDSSIIAAHDPDSEHFDRNIYGYWRHVGIYQTMSVAGEGILDAYPGKGVSVQERHFWETTYKELGLYSVKEETTNGMSNFRRITIAAKAASYLFKPYGFVTDKTSEDKFYCSKLIWKAFMTFSKYRFSGIDLDSNGGIYVLPDDIINHPLVKKIRSSVSTKR